MRSMRCGFVLAKPEAIGVDHVALAVLGDLAGVSVAVVLLDLGAADWRGWLQSSATVNRHSLRLRWGWKYCVPLERPKPLA